LATKRYLAMYYSVEDVTSFSDEEKIRISANIFQELPKRIHFDMSHRTKKLEVLIRRGDEFELYDVTFFDANGRKEYARSYDYQKLENVNCPVHVKADNYTPGSENPKLTESSLIKAKLAPKGVLLVTYTKN
jgi:hypothetical protein